MPAERKTPRVFLICTKGGRGGAAPDPHTCRSRNPPLEDPLQFFGQIFWEKILEIKIRVVSIPEERVLRVGRSDSARSDSGPGTVGHYLPEFAERSVNGNGGNGSPYSALRPANLTTLAHFSVSSAMSLPKSASDQVSIS